MLPKMEGKLSIWCQLKLIAGSALLLLLILIFGVVLPNYDTLSKTQNQAEIIWNTKNLNSLNITLLLQQQNTSSQLIILSNTTDPVNEQRKDYVLQMINNLWESLLAETKNPKNPETTDPNEPNENFQTLTLSLSTLWTAGLDEQFNKTWILLKSSSYFENVAQSEKVSKIVTDILGSLLSCYALTGEGEFWDLALTIADRLEPAYDNRTGISYPTLLSTSGSLGDGDDSLVSSLSEVGGQSLEYLVLASFLRNSTHAQHLLKSRVNLILSNLQASKAAEGFYADRVYVPSGIWASGAVTAYSSTSLFYSSLLKSAIPSQNYLPKNTSLDFQQMFTDALDSLISSGVGGGGGLVGTSKTGLKYTREYDHSMGVFTELSCMSSEGCYLGGLLALGSRQILEKKEVSSDFDSTNQEVETTTTEVEDQSEVQIQKKYTENQETQFKSQTWMNLAEELTETCYQAAIRSENKLLPERFCFDELNEATSPFHQNNLDEWEYQQSSSASTERDNEMRPDLAESYFILWRLTGEEKYRSRAWQMAQAIGKYLKRKRKTRSEEGNSHFEALASYHQGSSAPKETPISLPSSVSTRNLLGATLKYLYLIFSEKTTLPLEKWVFNSAGQPLPKSVSSVVFKQPSESTEE